MNSKSSKISAYVKRDAVITNVIIAALFSNFLAIYYYEFTVNNKFSALLLFIEVLCLIILFLVREYPKKTSYSAKDWGLSICAVCAPLLIFPTSISQEFPVLLIMQFIGVLISIAGILSLNTSFGILPAFRRIKTKGMYRFVRNPIYLGYFISFPCIVMQNFGVLNLFILCAIFTCNIMRIYSEEKILMEVPEYRQYAACVRWRILPYVW